MTITLEHLRQRWADCQRQRDNHIAHANALTGKLDLLAELIEAAQMPEAAPALEPVAEQAGSAMGNDHGDVSAQ